jgi:hypothetical protein
LGGLDRLDAVFWTIFDEKGFFLRLKTAILSVKLGGKQKKR